MANLLKKWEMTETLAQGYLTESTQRELSNQFLPRLVDTWKKKVFFVYAEDTDSMNDDMKLFKVICPYNWATDNKKFEMKVFGGCPSL